MTNTEIARQLRAHARVLSQTGNNLYRARAFRQAAMAVLALDRDAGRLGSAGLRGVPGIGDSLAETITTFAQTGRWEPRTAARRVG